VPEPTDIPKMAAEPEFATEQEEQPDEREEYEEGIMIRRSDLLHFQETLVDIRSQFANLQRDARQDRLEVQ
jgi:outer membrane protein TolC